MRRAALALALLLVGCVTVAPPSAVETAVAGTVEAYAHDMATYGAPVAQDARVDDPTPPCCCACPTRVDPGTGTATVTPWPTPTRIAPTFAPTRTATPDYSWAEKPFCGTWGSSVTLQDWKAQAAIAGGVNIRRGPGVQYERVGRMQDNEVFMVLRQYNPNAVTSWVCVYTIRAGQEVFGWSAQVYQGTKLVEVLP